MSIEEELVKRKIPYSVVKGKLPKRFRAFPSLENVLKYFCRKNNISKKYISIETPKGLIVSWDEKNAVLLSQDRENLFDLFNPTFISYIGEDGSHKYTSEKRTYEMSGILKGEEVNLKAKVSFNEDYEMKKDPNLCACCPPKPFPTGKTKREISREDNEKYWFLKKQKI